MSKRYEIRDQIGKGGLGAVYKALDTQLQREVAIKRVLSTNQATEDEVKEAAAKLIAEAQTLSSLNHPNIVTVFDVGQDEDGGFVVMELLKGETLDETVERGVLTQEDFTEVVYQTMEALIAAQASNVIHRDIKPTNIMVIWQASGKFQLKILDFGLAKFSKSPSVQTMDQDESVMGSIFFMAPEQFERGELDARTDLYQMGCVYYNALTGQYPFNGETAPQVMNAHLQHRVVPLAQVRPDLSPAICQWVMWLINRDIDHRPQDARDALKQWPRNPDKPAVSVLPLEETPQVSTGQVMVVRAKRGASAPPSLIVHTTGSAPIAAARRHTGTHSIGGRSLHTHGDAHRGSEGSGKTKWIVIGSIVLLVAGFGVFVLVGKSKTKRNEARIVQLIGSETPTGTAADVALAVAFLDDPKAPPALKTQSSEVLERLEGSGISEAIHAQLKTAKNVPLKLRLSKVLAERNYAPAVAEMVKTFSSATTDDQRLQVLQSIRAVADRNDIDTMLGALNREHSLPVRKMLEDTVLAVLRRDGNNDAIVDKILAKVSSSGGSERQSLFRILGVLGGEKVKARLSETYATGDIAYQRDALKAYLNWPDRSVLPELEGIISTAGDDVLRISAEHAYVRLATLPGPEPIEQLAPLWQKAFQLASKPVDVRDLISSLLEYPAPETLAVLKEWEKNPTHGAKAKDAANTLAKSMQGIVELKPGDEIKGNRARVRGDRSASINGTLSSLTGWVSPETYFSWSFKVVESGEYHVEVDQASLSDEPSDFVAYLAGKTLEGKSERTQDLEKFTTVRLDGSVQLEAGKIYLLTIAPGARIQPRMMDIGAIRLVK